MRKHGWQLPYHPLQVVAVAVFLALAFAFYVLFAPFVGKKIFQYIVIGLYTPLIPHLRPAEYKRSRLSRNRRTVNRAYGGVLSGGAVRERIIRATL